MNEISEFSQSAFEIKMPGDDGFDEYVFHLRQRQAETLQRHGWKFVERKGPRGTYYDAFSPTGNRIMSEQIRDKRAAFIKAIDHAFSRQFPIS